MTNVRTIPQPMTNEQLRAAAPSIFAETPWTSMSSRYTFIPTINVVDRMRSEGFLPVSAQQGRTRIPGKGDFTRHQLRFRDFRNGEAPAVRELGQIYPELVLTNSHDGTTSYILDAGLFRLICLNGMVVGDSMVPGIRTHHKGDVGRIVEATYSIVGQFPRVIDAAQTFAGISMSQDERIAFGTAALHLRYDLEEVISETERRVIEAPITAAQAVQPRRNEDKAPTLWNTFNAAQENLTQGGVRTYDAETRRRNRTRSVTGISEATKLNKALWTLAEEMKKLKGA